MGWQGKEQQGKKKKTGGVLTRVPRGEAGRRGVQLRQMDGMQARWGGKGGSTGGRKAEEELAAAPPLQPFGE